MNINYLEYRNISQQCKESIAEPTCETEEKFGKSFPRSISLLMLDSYNILSNIPLTQQQS